MPPQLLFLFFFFNDPATTEIYPLPLHDALPISPHLRSLCEGTGQRALERELSCDVCSPAPMPAEQTSHDSSRSEEHTSELQSPCNLVCRLLLEKKKKDKTQPPSALTLYPAASQL